MARRRSTVYVGEKRWKIVRDKRLRDCLGICDYDQRTIRVCVTLAGIDLLDTLIHELIHARWPDLSEDAVEEFASTLAAIIDAQGFREPDDHED